MDTNSYEIVVTDIAKKELEEIYKYISEELIEINIANKLMDKIENYIVLYEVDDKQKKVIIYRVVYGKTDYLKIE